MKNIFLQLMVRSAIKIRLAGIIGALAGMGLSGSLWLLVKKLIPARFFSFLTREKEIKKGKKNKNERLF